MSSKQNPDKVCIRLNKQTKERLMKVIEYYLKGYEGAYREVGYNHYAEYIHGILSGITWGLQICGATIEEVDEINRYVSTRMGDIEINVRKEQEDERLSEIA